jgi:hypothetical protein
VKVFLSLLFKSTPWAGNRERIKCKEPPFSKIDSQKLSEGVEYNTHSFTGLVLCPGPNPEVRCTSACLFSFLSRDSVLDSDLLDSELFPLPCRCSPSPSLDFRLPDDGRFWVWGFGSWEASRVLGLPSRGLSRLGADWSELFCCKSAKGRNGVNRFRVPGFRYCGFQKGTSNRSFTCFFQGFKVWVAMRVQLSGVSSGLSRFCENTTRGPAVGILKGKQKQI